MENVEEFHENENTKDSAEEKKKRPVIKTPTDLQRLKLEKLMKNSDKPIIIPAMPKEKDFMLAVPNFVRNVMGSSAGAGSGEFHVYRHLRRKEYARQKHIQAKSAREQLDDEYREKLEKNRLEAEAKTAKKRAKRLKKKQKLKERGRKKMKLQNKDEKQEESVDDDNTDSNESSDEEETKIRQDDKDDANESTSNNNKETEKLQDKNEKKKEPVNDDNTRSDESSDEEKSDHKEDASESDSNDNK